MPAPAVTAIMAVFTGVAAILAFKQFVYEPHLAPKLEEWAEAYVKSRQARRKSKEGPVAVPVPASSSSPAADAAESEVEMASIAREQLSTHRTHDRGEADEKAIELERLISSQVDAWRTDVERLQIGEGSRLRHRANVAVPPLETAAPDAPTPPVFGPSTSIFFSFDDFLTSTPGSDVLAGHLTSSSELSISSTPLVPVVLPTPPLSSTNGAPALVIFDPGSTSDLHRTDASSTNTLDGDSDIDLELQSVSSRPLSSGSFLSPPLSPSMALGGLRSPFDTLSEIGSDLEVEAFQSVVSHLSEGDSGWASGGGQGPTSP